MMSRKQMLRKKAQQELIIMLCSIMVILAVVLWSATGHAAQGKFQWSPNTESDLAGYKIYCKADAETDYPAQGIDVGLPVTGDDGKVHSELITVPDASASCVATAYDTDGNESEYSNHATFNLSPAAPVDFRVNVHVQVTVTQ